MKTANELLVELNTNYLAFHQKYEELFWVTNMGERSLDGKREKALSDLDIFRSDVVLRDKVLATLKVAKGSVQNRLQVWADFLSIHQMPKEAQELKLKIISLESKIAHHRSTRKEGYVDGKTGAFVEASAVMMKTLIQTSPDESVRNACFEAREKLAVDNIDDYVELVTLRNQFSVLLGYKDFYEYKLLRIDKMTKDELFGLFDSILEKVKPIFGEIREREKTQKGLRKPWNFSYLMSGDFTVEEDQYFQFDQALLRWGRSFSALGIDFKGGSLKLDLMERAGKNNNGFCHWPKLVHFEHGKRVPGAANFTCLLVPGQSGSGVVSYKTLFHEGGHAAHMLNCEQKDVCLNHEYAPMTAAWAETQSMFLDQMFSSIEWKRRYAENTNGEKYSLSLFEKKEKRLHLIKSRSILGIASVSVFEKEVYELDNPTAEKIKKIAKGNFKKYNDFSGDSLNILNTNHIYDWEASCAYHGYGLAEIALSQWRDYFFKKYGYIVDNKNVGKEMSLVWKLGSSFDFQTCVKMATGKKLSSTSLIREITMSPIQSINRAKKRLKIMDSVPIYNKAVNLNASVSMVHGKDLIASSQSSYEKMAEKYATWVRSLVQS